jgi:hypothetical protein
MIMVQFAAAPSIKAPSVFSLAALRRFAQRRAVALASLILLALVIQGVSFALSNAHRAHMALMAAAAPAQAQALQTQTVMLCTLQGFKAVQVVVDGEGVPMASNTTQPADGQHLMVGKLCPMCIVAQAFALLTPGFGQTAAPLFVTERLEPTPLPALAPLPVAHSSPPQQAPPAA